MELEQGPIASAPAPVGALARLLSLAWPIVLSRATQAVVGFCDALMVAPLGEVSLAAVSTGALNIWAVIMLPLGSAFILQSFAAQLRGRGDLRAAGRYGYYGLLLAAGAGLLALLTLPLLGPAVRAAGYASEVGDSMIAYMAIRLVSVAALIGTEALANWYGGLENTRIGLVFATATMVMNIAFNYLLIEPHFGLPGYGVTGAAWASTMASWVGFFGLLFCFLNNVGHEAPLTTSGLRWKEVFRMLRFGLPSGLNYFLEFAAFALFINVVIGHLGTTTLAAFNIVFQLNMMSFMPAFGVASAGAILVGEAIGREQQDHVPRWTAITLAVTASWMALVGLSYILFPRPFMEIFSSEGAKGSGLLEVGVLMLGLSGIWQLFDAVGLTFTEALRAAGDTTWPMNARIVLAWLVFTPLAWVSVRVLHGGPTAAILSVIFYIALLALILAYRFRSGVWRRIVLVEPELAAE